MVRRVYLHIGTMKSATSYLGQLCEANRDYLGGAGLLWPVNGLRYRAVRDFFHREVRELDVSGSWKDLRRQTQQFDGDLLLSNEMLAALTVANAGRLARAFSPAEVYVVLTARDLARVIPSHWQTTLKNGRSEALREFATAVCQEPRTVVEEADEEALDEHTASSSLNTFDWFWRRHDVAAILDRWSNVVPLERLCLVTVPPSGSDPELVARRFGAAIGVGLSGLKPPDWSNRSLGAHSAELLRRLNLATTDLSPAERSYGFRGALAGSLILTRSDTEPRFALTQEQQDWVRHRAAGMIEQIEKSGVRVEGDAADLMPAEHPPAGCVDPADTADADLLAAAAAGLTALVRGYTELRLDKRDLVTEVSALRESQDRLEDRVERQRKRILALVDERDNRLQGSTLRRGVRFVVGRSETTRRWAARAAAAARRLRRP